MGKIDITEGNKLLARFEGYEYFGFNDERLIENGFTYDAGWKRNARIRKMDKMAWYSKAYLCRNHAELRYYNEFEWLMRVIKLMNQKPWWIEYNSDSLAIALVSANIKEAWEIVVKAIIKYENKV